MFCDDYDDPQDNSILDPALDSGGHFGYLLNQGGLSTAVITVECHTTKPCVPPPHTSPPKIRFRVIQKIQKPNMRCIPSPKHCLPG